jgi:Glycosyltransferase family 87
MPTLEMTEDGIAEETSAPQRLRLITRLAIVAFCLVSLFISARQTFFYLSHGPIFADFRIFMTGVDLMKSGHAHELYHFSAQQIAQENLYPETRASGMLPFNHLAFELLFYWPFSYLSYQNAVLVWALVNLVLVFLIGWLLRPYTQSITRVTGLPVALYLLASYPVVYVLGEGQDSLIFLLLLVLSLRSMDSGFTFLAGMLLALGCFKLHLAFLVGFFALVLARKWKAIAGFAAGGALATAVSLAMVGPTLFSDYFSMLSKQEVMTPWGFFPFFMPNLRGFFRWTLRRYLEPGQILPVVFMASVIVGIVAAWLVVRRRVPRDSSLLYSVSILTTILISYHLHMQDLAIVTLPVLVVVDWALRNQNTSSRLSHWWVAGLALSVGSIYLYRLAAEPFPILLFRGCYLAAPVFLFWMVAFSAFCRNRFTTSQPAQVISSIPTGRSASAAL